MLIAFHLSTVNKVCALLGKLNQVPKVVVKYRLLWRYRSKKFKEPKRGARDINNKKIIKNINIAKRIMILCSSCVYFS